jgi:hypothetical protein
LVLKATFGLDSHFLLRVSIHIQHFQSYCFSGVGVDIRVQNSINFGLAASMEDLLQEGGRVMRGSIQETAGKQGYAFFLHKGALG